MKSTSKAGSYFRNDRKTWLSVASILAAGLITADGALIDYDGIPYTAGFGLPNQPGATPFFAGGWDANAAWGGVPGTVLQVQGNSALYPGIDSGGGSIAVGSQTFSDGWAGANSVANRASREFAAPWTSSTVGTYFISFLMGFGQDTIDSVGYRAFEMWSGSVGDNPGRVLQLGYSSYGDFGGAGAGLASMSLNVNPNGGLNPNNPLGVNGLLPLAGSTTFAADGGVTHLFVLRFDLSNVAGFDAIQVYLDPADLSSEGGNSPNAIFVGDFTASHLSAGSQFILPALGPDGMAGGPHDLNPLPASQGIFDELRIGDTWEGVVVPEPTSFTLLGLGGLGLMMARRKKT